MRLFKYIIKCTQPISVNWRALGYLLLSVWIAFASIRKYWRDDYDLLFSIYATDIFSLNLPHLLPPSAHIKKQSSFSHWQCFPNSLWQVSLQLRNNITSKIILWLRLWATLLQKDVQSFELLSCFDSRISAAGDGWEVDGLCCWFQDEGGSQLSPIERRPAHVTSLSHAFV